MVRKQKDQEIANVVDSGNVEGNLTMKRILNGPDELLQKGRAFNHCFLEPNSGLVYHVHDNTSETMYILNGTAEYSEKDDGEAQTLTTGDCMYLPVGEGHTIFNRSNEPLEFIALVLFE